MPDSIQRLRYHTGLFLEEQEFQLEQRYYTLLRRRVNFGLFESGILFGLDLQYDGTNASVTRGVALCRDVPSQEGRELLLDMTTPVPLTGFTAGQNVTIVLSYLEEARTADIKTPTNTPARVTEVARLEAVLTSALVPDPDVRVPLGEIVVGTALAGAAPGRRQAQIRGVLLPTPTTPGIVLNPTTVPTGAAAAPLTIIPTGGFSLTGMLASGVVISGGVTIASFANPGVIPGTVDLTLNTTAAAPGPKNVTVTNGPTSVGPETLTVAPGFTLTGFVGIDEPAPANNTNVVIQGTGFTTPLTVAFSATGGGFTAPLAIPNADVTSTTITIPRASIPPAAIPGFIVVTIPANPPLTSTFIFTPPPAITALSHLSRSVGQPLTITGTGFFSTAPVLVSVLFNPYTATATRGPTSPIPFPTGAGESRADTQLVALVETGATGTNRVRVRTAGGTAQSAANLIIV